MSTWNDWMVSARVALNAINGQGPVDALGLPVPLVSVVQATGLLGGMTRSILSQLDRLHPPGLGCAVVSDVVSTEGKWDDASLNNVGLTMEAKDYLSAYPPPPASVGAGRAWLRSRVNYADPSVEPGGWEVAYAGQPRTPGGYIYTTYTPNQYDDTSGQLAELHNLVAAYQRCCDAIAAGALSGADMSSPMDNASLLALWSAMGQVASSLDTLSDVPPRPPTGEVLQQAMNDAAEFVGDALAKAANVAGEVVGQAAKGVFGGLGFYGIAAVIGVLAIYFALN
jgi:hypothetical protein